MSETSDATVTRSERRANRQTVPAVVVGIDSLQGLQLTRCLHGHGVPVIGVARNSNSVYSQTRLAEEIVYVDTKGEPLVAALVALGKRLGQKAVMYPCTDITVLIVSRYREVLSEWFIFVLPDADVVELLLDKPNFYTYAQQQGLPIPPTAILHNREEAEAAAKTVPFPAILKPEKKTTLWEQNADGKVYKIDTPEAFLELYDRAADWTGTLILQEQIPGGEGSLIACNCYFTKDGKPVATFVSRKLRQYPPETGNGCLREEVRNDEVLRETLRLFEGVGYRGLGYVEMKRDERNGKHYFIEPNIGRPTGGSAIAEAGGVELHYALYCDALDLPLPPNLEQTYQGVKWLFLFEDLLSANEYRKRGQLTLRDWWRSISGKKRLAVISLQDPGPAAKLIINGIKERLKLNKRKSAGRAGVMLEVGDDHPAALA